MSAVELDDDIAGELHHGDRERPRSRGVAQIGPLIAIGVRAGLAPSGLVFLSYLVEYRHLDMPWAAIGSVVAIYGPAIGVLLALGVAGVLAVFDRVARWWRPLGLVFNALTAGALGGGLAGIAPGIFGVVVLGGYEGPFVGTPRIAIGLIGGAVLVAGPLAMRARSARRLPRRRAWVAVATVATALVLAAGAALVAPVIVGSAFAEARGAMDAYEWLVGAIAGALGGVIVGALVGTVVALARSFRVR